MPSCAHCQQKPCQTGDLSQSPQDCPSRGVDAEQSLARYSEPQRRSAVVAAQVEQAGYARNTRVEEIMDYANRLGYRRLGLAFCTGLSQEAAIFVKILRANGFEVASVCCKNGAVDKGLIGVPQEARLRPENDFEAMCNPAGQAAVLDAAGCELNILLGLCVGHDTLFFAHSKAPVTVLAAKDRALGHNPLAAIYTAEGYLKRQFAFLKK